jgi:hypothetical protein
MSGPHPIPYRDYIRICQLRWRQASRTVNIFVVTPDEFRQYVYVSVRVSVCHEFVQIIANCAVASFDYTTFQIRISTYLKLNTLFFNISWNDLFKNTLPLSVHTQIGHRRE